MSSTPEDTNLITRREAVKRVSILLGGIALVGGSGLITGCRDDRRQRPAEDLFSADEIAFLDEVADTILPETSTPGAKAAATGAFMALMVTDTYDESDQQVFREGMGRLDEACRRMHDDTPFMSATPQQRLALLEALDREQQDYTRRRGEAQARRRRGEEEQAPDEDAAKAAAPLPDQRQQGAIGGDVSGAVAITADSPAHYFRMMKELALLGYFTSEIGYTQAMRYVEAPGRFDPCVPYTPGETIWAPHA